MFTQTVGDAFEVRAEKRQSKALTTREVFCDRRRAHKDEKLEDFHLQNVVMRLKRLKKLLWKLPLIETETYARLQSQGEAWTVS